MPLTHAEIEARRNWIGASDIPALFNMGYRGRNAYDLWLEKTGKLNPEPTSNESSRGNFLESGLIDFAEKRIGKPVQRGVHVQCEALPILHANLDGLEPTTPIIIEGKSSIMAEAWENGATAPESVILQNHAQMLCVVAAEVVMVPVLLPFLKLTTVDVHRNADLCDVILEKVDAFWTRVTTDTPPEDMIPTLEVVKRVRRVAKKTVELSSHKEWSDVVLLRAAATAAEKKKKEAEATMIAQLGDAEAGILPDGSVVTYFEIARAGYSVDATTYRQLKFKKG